MMNATLMWLLLWPLVLSIVSIFVFLKKKMDMKEIAMFTAGGFIISALIMSAAFYIGKGSKTHDVEIWNGEILSKERIHDSYVRSYSCNCTETCSGSGNNRSCTQICQTCFEDHYTVTWNAHANVGNFTMHHMDETSEAVYNTPDPADYTRVRKGEPCAVTHSYTNYVKAVPESLFHPVEGDVRKKFANMIPDYPIDLYNRWKVNRVLSVGVRVPNLDEWNENLSIALKKLGPLKQANVVIVLVNTKDPTYAFALQDAWLNGKKNDIIVAIGASDFPNKADWVQILTLTDSEMFKIKLRDDLLALPTLNVDDVINTISQDTISLHKRKSMKEFKYLDAEIDPPLWVNVTSLVFITFTYFGFWAWQLQVFGGSSSSYNNRNRRYR